MAEGTDSHARMTSDGVRRACNYITDLFRGRKQAVTFFKDEQGNVRELGTGKIIDAYHPDKKKD